MNPRRAWAWAVVVLAVLAVVRLFLAATTGLGDDEAYYWHWSQQLAWGYLDHPPMVAWLVAGSTSLIGDNVLAVRVPAIACGVVTTALVAGLAVDVARARGVDTAAAGLAAVLLTQLPPLFGLSTVFCAPDGPLLAAWAGATWAAWRVMADDRPRGWWIVGVATGVALLCKHVAVLLPLGLLGAALSHETGRRHLRGPWPWLGVALAAAMWAPSVAWTAYTDWAPLRFHLGGRPGSGTLSADGTVMLLVGQVVYLGPALVPMMLGLRDRGAGRSLLWALSLPTVALFLLASPWIRPLPHWWAPAWVVAAAPAAVWLAHRPRWRSPLWTVLGLTTGALYLQAATGVLPVPPPADPTVDLVTWPQVERGLRDVVLDLPRPDRTVVASGRYQITAQAAWVLRDLGLATTRLGGRPDQYDLWQPAHAFAGWDVLWLDHDRYPSEPPKGLVERCAPATTLPVHRRGRAVRTVRLWRCTGGVSSAQPK